MAECGCRVLPLIYEDGYIAYCPLHARAEAMAEALRKIANDAFCHPRVVALRIVRDLQEARAALPEAPDG